MSEKIPTQMVLQIAEAIKKLSIEHANAALVIQAYCAQHDYHEAEVKKLRQTHWDMRAQAGFDNDGDPTPEHVVSDFSVLMIDDWSTVIRNQQESHDEWDALQQENITLRAELERAAVYGPPPRRRRRNRNERHTQDAGTVRDESRVRTCRAT